MAKLQIGTYDPRTESSPDTEAYRPGHRNDPPGLSGVILDRRDDGEIRVCACGCRGHVAGKSSYRIGHDMRLKGILTRAHLAGVPVHVIEDGKADPVTRTAKAEAKLRSTDKHDWVGMLTAAEAAQGESVLAQLAKANGSKPVVGQFRLVKGKISHLIALGKDGQATYEYIDGRGAVKQTTLKG